MTGADGWTTRVRFQTYDDRPAKRPWLVRSLAGTRRIASAVTAPVPVALTRVEAAQ